MLFPNRLASRSSNSVGYRLTFHSCYASSEIQKGKRRRRYVRSKRRKSIQKKDQDLDQSMIDEIRAEQSQWEESITPGPDYKLSPETRAIMMLVLGSLSVNPRGYKAIQVMYEEHLPDSRYVFDFLEIRLLESKDFPNSWMIDLFLGFGYTLKNKFVLKYKGKPIYCKVLNPPHDRELPKMVFSSLKIEETLSMEAQQIINKKMESWKSLSANYSLTDLRNCRGVPWDLLSKAEMDVILKESEFAAWCMFFGFTPACVAMLANEMYDRTVFEEYISSLVSVPFIQERLEKESFLKPADLRPIWRDDVDDQWLEALATVPDFSSGRLFDDKIYRFPSTCVAFINRPLCSDKQDYKHEINHKLMSYMYGSFKAAFVAISFFHKLHEAISARARQKGRVLTLDGSNPKDEKFYTHYFHEVGKEMSSHLL